MNSKIKISEKGFYSKGPKQLSVHKWEVVGEVVGGGIMVQIL